MMQHPTGRPPMTFPRMVARFVSGRPIDGVPRSNSTFLQPGTRVVGMAHRDRPSRWMALPGWKRAAWRMGVTLPAAGNAAGLIFAPVPTYLADGTLAAGLTAWGSYRAGQAVRTRAHRRQWVKPLHTVLAPVLGYGRSVRPDEYLQIPRGFQTDEDAVISVRIPADFEGDPSSRERVADIIRTRLALRDADVRWELSGSDPVLTVKQAPKPPGRVVWADARTLIEAAPDSAPLLGVGRKGRPIAVDLDSDSPHILVSMSTGGGKSVLLRGIASQVLNRGGRVVICDIKRVSHQWARGLPGVIYARSPEEIHEALIAVADEGSRRYEVIEADGEGADVGPRTLLVLEEMNATMGKLSRYWAAVRDKDDPKNSPAIEALGDILFMGRQAKMHVVAVGQLMTARAMGGPEMRECFSTRILARYTTNAWRMLVPEVWPMPKSSRHPGRVQVVLAGEAHETQVLFGTEAEARAHALAGRVPASHASLTGHHQGNAVGTVPGRPAVEAPRLRLVPPAWESAPAAARPAEKSPQPAEKSPFSGDPNTPVTLREAAFSGLLSLSETPEKSLEVLRAARKRDPEFPAPAVEDGKTMRYLPSDLLRWSRNRPRAAG